MFGGSDRVRALIRNDAHRIKQSHDRLRYHCAQPRGDEECHEHPSQDESCNNLQIARQSIVELFQIGFQVHDADRVRVDDDRPKRDEKIPIEARCL